MAKRVVILHGYTASPGAHWFPWLARELMALGAEVSVPALPTPDAPQPDAWIETAHETLGEPDEDLVVVGHSLGCITALRALALHEYPYELGGLVMVSGFQAALPSLPGLDSFTRTPLNLSTVAARTRIRAVLSSDTDEIVPSSYSRSLAQSLNASFDEVPGAGHFLDRDGHLQLPLAYHYSAKALVNE